jgi:hypothetical protein
MNITLDSLYLDIQIKNFDQVFDTAICWTVLTEDSIYYEGTNGETIHNQAMRDMTYSDLIHSNLDTSLTHSLQLPPDFSVDDTYHLVTFIQDKETKEIIQAIDRALPEIDS